MAIFFQLICFFFILCDILILLFIRASKTKEFRFVPLLLLKYTLSFPHFSEGVSWTRRAPREVIRHNKNPSCRKRVWMTVGIAAAQPSSHLRCLSIFGAIYVHMHMYIYIRFYICIHGYMCIYMYIYMYKHISKYVCI